MDGYRATLTRIIEDHGLRELYVPDFDRTIGEPVAACRVVPADARLVATARHPVDDLVVAAGTVA